MSDNLNPTLEQALKELLNNLTEAKQFVLAQAPDVLQQIIYKQFVSAIFVDIVAVVLIVITAGFTWWLIKRDKDIDPVVVPTLLFGFGALGFSIAGIVETYSALVAFFAPKVYLIEYIAKLVKG